MFRSISVFNLYLKHTIHSCNMKCVFILVFSIMFLLIYRTQPYTRNSYITSRKKIRVVCSLTTRPEQPYYFADVLDRLVGQFDAVYLVMPYVSCKGIKYPEFAHPGVTIVRPEKDYGPITKFMGALDHEKDPRTVITVLDDDIIYSKNIRKQFEENHKKYPDAVISGAGIVYKYYNFLPSFHLCITGRRPSFPFFIPSILGNNHTTTVAGYSGITFRRGLIDKGKLLSFIRVWNRKPICFTNDDMTISAFFSKNNIKRLCIPVDDSKPPKDKDTESISSGGIQQQQFEAFKCLSECFSNEPFRHDCINGLDITFIILCLIVFKIALYICK